MSALLLVALLFQESLIDRLASDDPVERDKAVAALIEMGAAVRPALEKRKNDPDAEVRAQIPHILTEIARLERVSSVRPKSRRVTLTLRDVPAADAAKKVFEPFGVAPELKATAGPRISLAVENATLWEALDAFCAATGLRANPIDAGSPQLSLCDPGGGAPAGRAVNLGDVRVAVRVAYSGKTLSANSDAERNDLHVAVEVALPPGHRPLDWALEDVRLFGKEETSPAGQKSPHRLRVRASPTGLSVWKAALKGAPLEMGGTFRLEGTLVLRYPRDVIIVEFDLRTFQEKLTKEHEGWKVTVFKTAEGNVDATWETGDGTPAARFLGWLEDATGAAVADLTTMEIGRGGFGCIWKLSDAARNAPPAVFKIARVEGDDVVKLPVVVRDIPVPKK